MATNLGNDHRDSSYLRHLSFLVMRMFKMPSLSDTPKGNRVLGTQMAVHHVPTLPRPLPVIRSKLRCFHQGEESPTSAGTSLKF